MPRLLLAATLLLAPLLLLAAGTAHAFTGKCILQVDGKTHLDGPCPMSVEQGGDFTIGTDGTKSSRYFAKVSIDKAAATADGWWNGSDGATHAHDPLGTLKRQGACWVNERAKVRATR